MRNLLRGLSRLTLTTLLLAGWERAAAALPVELGMATGATTYVSTWRGDVGGGGTLRLGARFGHVLALEFQGWESYASINHRVNTGLSLGIAGYLPLKMVHPYARFFVLHQHEEAVVSVENAPAGVALGIGSGIRHRAGGGLSIGSEVPFKRLSDRLTPTFITNATTTWFPDALGPTWYVGLDIGVGLDYLL